MLLVAARSQHGDIAGAQAAADAMEHEGWRARAHGLIATRQAQAGHVDRAIDLLGKVTDLGQRDRSRRAIVEALVRDDRRDDAQEMVEAITSPEAKAQAQLVIAQAEADLLMPRARSPFLDEQVRLMSLFAWTTPADDAAVRAWHAARRGEAEGFAAHADEAVAWLKDAGLLVQSAATLNTLAVAAFEGGFEDEAIRFATMAAQDVEEEGLVSPMIFGSSVLSYIHVRLTPWPEVRKELVDETGVAIFTSGVAAALAETGRYGELGQWVEELGSAGERIEAFAEVASALAAGEPDTK